MRLPVRVTWLSAMTGALLGARGCWSVAVVGCLLFVRRHRTGPTGSRDASPHVGPAPGPRLPRRLRGRWSSPTAGSIPPPAAGGGSCRCTSGLGIARGSRCGTRTSSPDLLLVLPAGRALLLARPGRPVSPAHPGRGGAQGRAEGPASTHERAAALDAGAGKGWEPVQQANGRGVWGCGAVGVPARQRPRRVEAVPRR